MHTDLYMRLFDTNLAHNFKMNLRKKQRSGIFGRFFTFMLPVVELLDVIGFGETADSILGLLQPGPLPLR